MTESKQKSPAESVKALLGEPNPMGDYFYPDGSSIRRAGKFYVASWADGTAMMGLSEQTGLDVVWRFESPEEALVCLRDNDEGPFAKAVVSQVAYADLVAENERLRARVAELESMMRRRGEFCSMLMGQRDALKRCVETVMYAMAEGSVAVFCKDSLAEVQKLEDEYRKSGGNT